MPIAQSTWLLYVFKGSRWRVKDLTFKVTKYLSGLTKAEVDREVKKALKVITGSRKINILYCTTVKMQTLFFY